MALKKKLTAADYKKLAKDLKAHYKVNEDDEDEYLLDTEDDGEEGGDALRRARDREKQKAKDAKKRADALEAKLKKAGIDPDAEDDDDDDDDNETGEGGDGWKTGREAPPKNKRERRSAKDIDTIERTWKDRVKNAETKGKETLSKANEFIKKSLIGNAASSLASQISTAPELMSKAIRDRLTVDFDGDEPRLVILDKDGEPSELTLDKLGKEFTANKEYAAIIRGSKASGGGASQHGPDTKAPARGGASEDGKSPDLARMPVKDLTARLKAQKEASS